MISRAQIASVDYTVSIILNQFTLLGAKSVRRVRAAGDAAEERRLKEAEEELNETLDEHKEASKDIDLRWWEEFDRGTELAEDKMGYSCWFMDKCNKCYATCAIRHHAGCMQCTPKLHHTLYTWY